MRIFLILIILIYYKISINFAFTLSNRLLQTTDQLRRSRRDSPPMTNQLITIPGYRMNNGTNQSAPIFCPSNPSTYLLKSIIFNNIDSTALATLSTPDQPSSIMSTATTRGVLLVFNNPPISQCYLINFLSITFAVNSIDLNNVKVQFVYDPSNVGGGATRSVASNNGFGNWSYSFTSNANSGCGSVTCQNGGICQYMGASGYQCQCDSSGRWLGNDCSKANPCIWSPCYNSGHCYYLPDATYYCVCYSGYSGSNCQYSPLITATTTVSSYNPCLSVRPCLNGGTCLPQGNPGGFTCTCPQGYTGVNCQSLTYLPIATTAPPISCGTSYDRIVGGTSVRDHTWPWIVSLQTMYGGSHFVSIHPTSIDLTDNHILNLQCGGTLVDALHVVTASHCFDQAGTSPENFKVVAGLLNLRQTSAAGVQQFAVDRIFRHEQYSSTALVNDITVIKLRTPAQFTEAVYPICLPSGNGAQDPPVGQNVLIAGWGYTNSATKQISDQLQQATIQILDFNGDLYGGPGCNAWARRGYSLSSSRQICAMSRDTRIDSCQGDSGGPLIGEVQSRWYLFGIVSYGDSVCASSTAAGVYTRVSAYTAWVQQKLLL